ncbi:MAG: hypothetical protein WD846_00815 [Patescibacteria group bacterium]
MLTITATNQTVGARQRTLRRSGVRVGPVTVRFVFVVALGVLALFYLVQSNRVSTQNLQLKAMEAQKAEITAQNERLSTEAARLQSLQQIKKSADGQGLRAGATSANAYAS